MTLFFANDSNRPVANRRVLNDKDHPIGLTTCFFFIDLMYFEMIVLQAGRGDYGHSRRCCEGSSDEPTNRQVCVFINCIE